ncbi:uncharacterized protein LOC109722308 [Ananas comosus]|uniref:Uncharacterized protein LOC109722308 n=1 Tax=Ananas comosus TaxID=4615 RepID=A0A6P5GD11_ANACO|nr:uncharacterized protein LOC109722308 [Ananas comosus]
MANEGDREETIEEEEPSPISNPNPNPNPNPSPRSAQTKAPEVEIHLFRGGRGPIDVFRSRLGGWDQNQLEVQDILDKYGFKSLHAFNPSSGRSVAVRFNPRNGRSLLPYADGSVVFVDGEPKDSLVKPVTKILVGVAVITLLVALFFKEAPEWLRATRFSAGNFPPWILACIVIVFTRLRKRTRDVLKKFGW